MRLNRFLALATGMSRRSADKTIAGGKVYVNGAIAEIGQQVTLTDKVTFNNQIISTNAEIVTIMLNKPVGFVSSRSGQGNKTIYDLLPKELHILKPIGRLDKDSSGLLLLTNDGKLANELTHPKYAKDKIYKIELDKPLSQINKVKIESGVLLEDGLSKMSIEGDNKFWTITMSEGRNRQIRRTFEAVNHRVMKLHRIQFGNYHLGSLQSGKFVNS